MASNLVTRLFKNSKIAIYNKNQRTHWLKPMTSLSALTLPDHTQLPDSDGTFVKNWQEHPKSILLTDSTKLVLEKLHPDSQYCIGQDLGIYWRLTDPPVKLITDRIILPRFLEAVELGIWQGFYQNAELPWLRWWDTQGNLLLMGEERAVIERERAEVERQKRERIVDKLRRRSPSKTSLSAEQLNALGIDLEMLD
jgi:hypothetical protein